MTDRIADVGADVAGRMRDDWNQRAREDAHYYVAFGRRNQTDEEFFETGLDRVRELERELRRLPLRNPRSRRAIEIGCGPGRLMRPMSRHFGEIHGIDISDEMVRLAREKLGGIPHAHVHHAPNSTLDAFADDSFDFVYSYAVFQHIPSREVVFGYLKEAARVLKPGGVLRCQLNGLPQNTGDYDTWSGVRVTAADVLKFAGDTGLFLLALEGALTQYMWVTLQKPADHRPGSTGGVTIRRITSAFSSEPRVPVKGRFAVFALWVSRLPADCDLNRLQVLVGGRTATPVYIGPPESDGLRQVNVSLPAGLGTGLERVELLAEGQSLCDPGWIRLMTPGPAVPRLVSLTDGIDLMSGTTIVTGWVKATVEEVGNPEEVSGWIDDRELESRAVFCTDPSVPRWEVNWKVPPGHSSGEAEVRVLYGRRELGRIQVQVVRRT